MSGAMSFKVLIAGTIATAGFPAAANRLTLEVWPDTQPDHAVFCSVSLVNGWITLVQAHGLGLPAPHPLRWRASQTEDTAMTAALQAFLSGELVSVDPYGSRLPPPPFVTITWMTTLNDDMATGLYIQSGLPLPTALDTVLTELALDQACGLSATGGGQP
jgi:hypothetical protein